MAMAEFSVPNHPEDLEVESPGFFVRTVTDLTVGDAGGVLDAVGEALLADDDALVVAVAHDVFDGLYSLIKCVGAAVGSFPPRGAGRAPAEPVAPIASKLALQAPPAYPPRTRIPRPLACLCAAGTGPSCRRTRNSAWWRP